MLNRPVFEFSIATNPHGKFCIPKEYQHRPVPKMLLRGEIYEPETQEYLASLSEKGDIICGGAFVGDFLPRLDRAARFGGRVHTFEPNPTSFASAQHTIELNELKNCIIHQCGVGQTSGTLNLQVAKPNGSAMAARARIVPDKIEGQTIEIPIISLDSLIPADRPIAAIQLDIEGHEEEAVKGAHRIIQENRPVVIIEAERPHKQQRFLKLLNDLFPEAGYQLDLIIERNSVFLPRAATA
ncbi:FkbM family methyltransferase [uncultured Sulfitobacter sp.]|uniref:FkbM family methyltransferase n=1 Tax=uncultured Sulfitobacter sp. TaxID=191468 RepID=UPI0026164EF4|nr:FkbM family methyltransferase [uncultured Sulfitobacter sp.]